MCIKRVPFIAVIDDDSPLRAALVESLLSVGYAARGFASAEEFMSADEQVECGCVITDVHMSGMSGLDLKLLLSTLNSKVPVIMITARTDPSLEERAAAVGAVGFLRKPFEPTALLECVRTALRD